MALHTYATPRVTNQLPSFYEAALAIAVVRTKPPDMTTRGTDYILKLRRHLRQGCHPVRQPEAARYLDLVAYWQEQCKQVEEERDRLRSININLERSNEFLTSQVGAVSDIEIGSRASKRKATTTSSAKPPKRPRATQKKTIDQSVTTGQDTTRDDLEFLHALDLEGACLSDALYNTHRLCKTTDIKTEQLCFSLVETCSALGKVIRVVVQNQEKLANQERRSFRDEPLKGDSSEFANALAICARAFMSVLAGMSKIVETQADHKLSSMVTYAIAETFKSALFSMEVSAQRVAQLKLSHTIETESNKKKKSAIIARETDPVRAVACLLASFLGFLDRRDPRHQQVFQTCIFVLFERAGRRLYYCTFGRHRGISIEDAILPPQRSRGAAETAKRSLESLATRHEMKALVLILERAISLAPGHINLQLNRPSGSSARVNRTTSFSKIPTASRAQLNLLAKDRLQRTLIACMYGERTDDEFLDVLTKPVAPMRLSSRENVVKVDDENVEEWYKQEIWRLVGWDILGKESGW